MLEIKSCITGNILATVDEAKKPFNFSGLNLEGANFENMDLRGANFSKAKLWRANFQKSNLQGASFNNCKLVRACFADADLTRVSFNGADLYGANFKGANLQKAKLTNASLIVTMLEKTQNIPEPWIQKVKRDFLRTVKIFRTNGEVKYLRTALLLGLIDGTQYHGSCACLIGTLVKASSNVILLSTHLEMDQIIRPPTGKRYKLGLHNSAEQWFYQINKGDTPADNFFDQKALEWCDEIIANDKLKT